MFRKVGIRLSVSELPGWQLERWTDVIFLIFLNWRMVASQCCVKVLLTTKWISYMDEYIPSLLHFPCSNPTALGHHRALGWAPRVRQRLPTSSFIHGSVYTLGLLSQFLPPSSFPTVSTSPLFTSVTWLFEPQVWKEIVVESGLTGCPGGKFALLFSLKDPRCFICLV